MVNTGIGVLPRRTGELDPAERAYAQDGHAQVGLTLYLDETKGEQVFCVVQSKPGVSP